MPKIGTFVHFGPGLVGSFGVLLVGWLVVVARAVSRKTPLYFILRNAERIVFYESTRERHTVVLFKISILSNLVMQAKSENI